MSTTLQHIPTWVFGLLCALIALGVSQSFPRSITLRRSAVLPIVLVGVSLAGVVSTFGQQPLALLAWALGLAGAVAALHGRIDTAAVRFSPVTQRFQMPGSWVPLALMLGLFAIKFGAGMSLALHPELRGSTFFALAMSAAYGLFSGVFLGRAMALWTLARRTLLQHA
ncbi:MAG: hypothetical protein KF891_16840 [Rhizobacter sp.]|nr:hypothetical protein [Rhizobacter sp.]